MVGHVTKLVVVEDDSIGGSGVTGHVKEGKWLLALNSEGVLSWWDLPNLLLLREFSQHGCEIADFALLGLGATVDVEGDVDAGTDPGVDEPDVGSNSGWFT